MSVMPVKESGLPRGRALTREDLDAMPDDGHRYELLDGVLIVSPAPSRVHQRAVGRLFLALENARSENVEVLVAPFDVVLAPDTVMQPDVLVAARTSFTDRDLPEAPLLAIEVLSPSTRGLDVLLKKDRLQRAGCQHYWVVDPLAPSITGWLLEDGVYRQVVWAEGDETMEISEPFPLRLTPSQLVV